jgi:geranylgeranyl diphosphate synthase type II
LVNQSLERSLPSAATPPQVLHEAMRYAMLGGGKRFRPLLVLGGCEALGKPARLALPVACALELVHTYSLVHDDLPAMDNSDERRGQMTVHRKFGEGNAVLVGDALLTLAFEVLAKSQVPNVGAIIQEVAHACGTTGLIGGQVLDLQVISQVWSGTEKILRDIAQRKTAALIAGSVMAGGLAGGAKPEALKRLQRFGQHIGLAFQLIDDVHDREGLAQAMGAAEAQLEAQRLIHRGIDALQPFGARAGLLRDAAMWLASTS